MCPILWSFGPVTLYTYGISLVAAFLLTTRLAARAARRLPPSLAAISAERFVDLASAALLGGLLGGRAYYVLLHWPEFASVPLEILAVWHGGLVWYGGFLGGFLAGWLYLRAKRLPLLRVLDQIIPFLALGHAIGRVGCFFNGCCYGRPTAAWFGVRFPGHPDPVIPTQLLEAAGLVLLFFQLRRLQQPAVLQRPGQVFGAYLAGYGLLRFLVEFLRGDQSTVWMGLSLAQYISLGLVTGGVALRWTGGWRGRTSSS